MTAQSDWLPMMMATGFGAPFTSARRAASRRDSWDLRLKEGDKARKRAKAAGVDSPALSLAVLRGRRPESQNGLTLGSQHRE
jgi:hypothetical protein